MRLFALENGLENVQHHVYCDEDVEHGIYHFCLDEAIDCVVIGTHGKTGFKHFFEGSISEDLVNHIPQLILTYKV
jgi:nucleotide-binding universal stress UspA family protein